MHGIKQIYFEQIKKNLPQATFVNVDPLLWKLRIVKTDEEISRLRIACRAISKAADAAFKNAYVGMTELEMEKIIYKTIIDEGCIPINSLIAFGPKGAYLVSPTGNQLEEGQIMRVDIVAEYKGYQGDISMATAFGKVSQKAAKGHGVILTQIRH